MKKILTVLLALTMTVSCFSFCISASAQDTEPPEGFLFSFNYSEKNNGIVDRKMTAVLEKVEMDGKNVLKVVPDPDNALDTKLRLDCYSLKYPAKDIENARFVTVEYKYDAPADTVTPGKMYLNLLVSGGALKTGITAHSMNDIEAGGWKTAVFDMTKITGNVDTTEGKIFKQMHFYPYGQGTNPKNLTKDQVMYIGDITF